MVTEILPFFASTDKRTFEKIVYDDLLLPDQYESDEQYMISDGFKDFIKKALHKDPYQRITIDEALRHPWIQGISPMDMKLNQTIIEFLRQYGYQSKLKQLVTTKIAQYDHDELVRMHFDRLDTDNDGLLVEKELEDLLLNLGCDPFMAEYEAKKILFHADLDGDRCVDYREFKRLWHRKLLFNDEYITQIFNTYNDQLIDDEFMDINEIQMCFGGNLKEIEQMVIEWDSSGDNKLSFDDFKKAMQEYPPRCLIYGYIRNVHNHHRDRVSVCDSERTTMVETKLFCVNGNLYYNFQMDSHLLLNAPIDDEDETISICKRFSAVDYMPLSVIDTICDILNMLEVVDTTESTEIPNNNGRTNNLC